MANKTIKDYQDNTSIDGANDYFLGEQNSTGDYRRYTRNTIMGVTGQPADLSSVQTFTNKTLTSPVITTPTMTTPTVTSGMNITSGTLAVTGNETVGGTLAVTGVLTPSAGLSANSVTNAALVAGINSGKLYNPYKFSVYYNGSASLSGTSKIPFNIENYDTNSNFDNVTNFRYTAPVSGFYHFTANLSVSSPGPTRIILHLYKNGSAFARGTDYTATTVYGAVFSLDVSVAAGDYFEMYYQLVSGTGTFDNVATFGNSFSGFLISTT